LGDAVRDFQDDTRDTRRHRSRLIDPAASAEVVVGMFCGKAGAGVTLCSADDRDFAGLVEINQPLLPIGINTPSSMGLCRPSVKWP
jgi:hypothetical protein